MEAVLAGVQDLAFSLSLRMLGTFHDAEDASQDILDAAPETYLQRAVTAHLAAGGRLGVAKGVLALKT